jgi:hypothetical protein
VIFREFAPVIPLALFTLAIICGVEPHEMLVAFGVCTVFGWALYVAELHHRFRDRGGKR